MAKRVFLSLLLFASLSSCARVVSKPVEPTASRPQTSEYLPVVVSYYGEKFAGKRTASGEIFEPNALTAAHKTLPFGTRLEVRNPKSGDTVQVRINDRGPFIPGRDLDISAGAAKKLGVTGVHKLEMRLVSNWDLLLNVFQDKANVAGVFLHCARRERINTEHASLVEVIPPRRSRERRDALRATLVREFPTWRAKLIRPLETFGNLPRIVLDVPELLNALLPEHARPLTLARNLNVSLAFPVAVTWNLPPGVSEGVPRVVNE